MYNANKAKIIPFPGVSLKQGDSFQNTLEDTEAPEVRGLLQSDSYQNEIENFMREMGYVEYRRLDTAPEKVAHKKYTWK